MSITFNTPQQRTAVSTARVLSFKINTFNEEAVVTFETGHFEGTSPRVFMPTGQISITFSNFNEGADFTYDQLLSAVPEVRDLGKAMETVALNAGIFDGVIDP